MSKLFKTISCLLAVVFVLSISLVKTSSVRAICLLTATPTQIKDAGTSSQIVLTGNGCFTGTPENPINYVVIAYPENLSLEEALNKRAFAIHRDNYWGSAIPGAPAKYVTDTDKNSLSTTLDFGYEMYKPKWVFGKIGFGYQKKLLADKYNNRYYKVIVCIANLGNPDATDDQIRKNLKQCTGSNFIAGETKPESLWVGENPHGTTPDDLPVISIDSQTSCSFRIGSPIVINQINNITQDAQKDYGWWQYDISKDNHKFQPGELESIDPDTSNPTIYSATMSQYDPKVFKPGSQRICIDLTKYDRSRAENVQFQNCLFIDLTAGIVDQPMSCDDIQEGSLNCSKYPGRCSSAGGSIVKGCNDPTDPNNPNLPNPNPGIPTAIGCIRTNPVELTKSFLKFALGISGGLAFLLMIFGAFQMLTSAGNPETLNAGKERLTSAVIGLLLIIFSVLLLQIIGFDILGLPGFGR